MIIEAEQYELLISAHITAQFPLRLRADGDINSLRHTALKQFDDLMLTSKQIDYEIAYNFVFVNFMNKFPSQSFPNLLNILEIRIDD